MRKSLLVLAVLLIAVSNVNAQIEAGKISVGGTLNVSSNSTKYKDGSSTQDGAKDTQFTFGPQVGYFFSENLSVGAGLVYQHDVATSADGETKNIGNRFIFSPFGRYHIPLGEKVYLFGEAKLNFGLGSRKTKTDGDTDKIGDLSSLGFTLSPGIILFPSERIGIELAFNLLSFDRVADKDPDNGDNKTIRNDFSFGPDLFSPTLGVQLYF